MAHGFFFPFDVESKKTTKNFSCVIFLWRRWRSPFAAAGGATVRAHSPEKRQETTAAAPKGARVGGGVLLIVFAVSGWSRHRVSKRYAINPLGHKWTHRNITYRLESFPNTLSADATRKALGAAFAKWSDVSPLSFTEVLGRHADISIGFYAFNHSDCQTSPLHPCFDGVNGELAHAFLPPRGEIHFDDHELWIVGRSRFSWKRGVWLNDLVQVAAHEIGHALGLWHSGDPRALMHPNATFTGQRDVGRDDVAGIRRLYGCGDQKRACASWARSGLCERRKPFMTKKCPRSCQLCFEPPEAAATPTPPANVRVKVVPRGKVVGFRCGTKNPRASPRVSWYKDGERIAASVPGHIALKGRDLRIVANEFNEGVYTCRLHRLGKAAATNSWRVRLRTEDDHDVVVAARSVSR
ncbi:matrix metallopeptidase 23bb isoform X5 [Syngnathoides biaculeatus]|uniref:matrix metallopeptidase 23bb isoform X5 n=1 Tax=Syngnathoides biaculeatus TaxID=300417 RepID=UPI002ADD406F|nr:matrix metallopeptidase 23bb isoform X5 [Syngnathoides biaculeatus]